MRIEHHNLDGRGERRTRVYDMTPLTQPVYSGVTPDLVVGAVPDYWAAVTDVPCPCCGTGTIRWAEAGYVPGYRICDGCGRHYLAGGTGEAPTLMRMGSRRSRVRS